MKLIVAPEPTDWLETLVTEQPAAHVRIVAPWALRAPLHWLSNRRRAPANAVLTAPISWYALERFSRATDGAVEAKLRMRGLLDRLVAVWLKRTPSRFTEVIAPSLAARQTFAIARVRNIKTRLVDDLPGLRELHRDLDRAAQALPQCTFLNTHRTGPERLIDQEQERVLADAALTTSALSCKRLVAAGVPVDAIEPLVRTRPSRSLRHDPQGPLLLAGDASSRYGLEVALAALEHTPHTLVVKGGAGTYLPSLRNTCIKKMPDDAPLGVRAVLAPAWVECLPPEIEAAHRQGVPIIATTRAAGWLREGIHFIAPGDAVRLEEALRRVAH